MVKVEASKKIQEALLVTRADQSLQDILCCSDISCDKKNDNRPVQYNAQQHCEGTQRLQNEVSMFLGMDEGGSTSSPVAGGFCMMNPEF